MEVLADLKKQLTDVANRHNHFLNLKKSLLINIDKDFFNIKRAVKPLEKKIFDDNNLPYYLINYLTGNESKQELINSIDSLKQKDKDLVFYKDLKKYITGIGSDKNSTESDFKQLINTVFYIDSGNKDIKELENQGSFINLAGNNKLFSYLNPYDEFNDNKMAFDTFNQSAILYLDTLTKSQYQDLLAKRNFNITDYKNIFGSFSEMSSVNVDKSWQFVKQQASVIKAKYNNETLSELIKPAKFIFNQNENNLEVYSFYLLNNYFKNKDFLDSCFDSKFMLSDKSNFKKQYSEYGNNLYNILTKSRIASDFNRINKLIHLKDDTVKTNAIALNQEVANDITNSNNGNDIEALKQSIYEIIDDRINDVDLVNFVKSYYAIPDVDFENILDKNSNLIKNPVVWDGKSYSANDFRRMCQGVFINEFIMTDSESAGHNLQELYKDIYVSQDGQYVFKEDSSFNFITQNQQFRFDVKNDNYNNDKAIIDKKTHDEYISLLNKKRLDYKNHLDNIIMLHNKNKTEIVSKINKMEEKYNKKIKKLAKDGIVIKTLNLLKSRYLIMSMMMLCMPLAFGLLPISFLVHSITNIVKGKINKNLLNKIEEQKQKITKDLDVLEKNKVKTFTELNQKINKIQEGQYQEEKNKKQKTRQKNNLINDTLTSQKSMLMVNINDISSINDDDKINILKNTANRLLNDNEYLKEAFKDNDNPLFFKVPLNVIKGKDINAKKIAFMKLNDFIINPPQENKILFKNDVIEQCYKFFDKDCNLAKDIINSVAVDSINLNNFRNKTYAIIKNKYNQNNKVLSDENKMNLFDDNSKKYDKIKRDERKRQYGS